MKCCTAVSMLLRKPALSDCKANNTAELKLSKLAIACQWQKNAVNRRFRASKVVRWATQ